MRFAYVIAALATTVVGAAAQQQKLTPEQMAATSLGQQIGQLALQNFQLTGQLEAAQAKIKELEAKTCDQPKPPEK